MGICVVRLTTNFKIKYDTHLAYNIYTVLCAVNIGIMIITLNTRFNFGKYKGELVEDLLYADYDIDANNIWNWRIPYFFWLDRNTEHKLDKDVHDRINVLYKMKQRFMQDIPKSTENKTSYEHEPRLWGNDCFLGEMSSWF